MSRAGRRRARGYGRPNPGVAPEHALRLQPTRRDVEAPSRHFAPASTGPTKSPHDECSQRVPGIADRSRVADSAKRKLHSLQPLGPPREPRGPSRVLAALKPHFLHPCHFRSEPWASAGRGGDATLLQRFRSRPDQGRDRPQRDEKKEITSLIRDIDLTEKALSSSKGRRLNQSNGGTKCPGSRTACSFAGSSSS